MDIKVRVLTKRKCFASIEFDDEDHIDVYVMSFGDNQKPDTDVEVEFTPEQLKKLRTMLNKASEDNEDFLHEHYGEC